MDRRVMRTRRAIMEAYVALRRQKVSLTVALVADQADIGRGTFYLHFKDIQDLEDQVLREAADQVLQRLDQTPLTARGQATRDWVASLMLFLRDLAPQLGMLADTGQGLVLRKQVQAKLEKWLQPTGAVSLDTRGYAAAAIDVAISGLFGDAGTTDTATINAWLAGALDRAREGGTKA
ncbi:TetR/AcrR family transcriptional regulator [Lacticaseibacillus mingshuiensis]|uniref:TetR/AcrR family transcriptional regulator n=1 Tax=Lacticaseibacillus mingshuiensis TaxID=2799574 RepID=A0ABW4CFK3_9LACO|nr:TetR/AcrR family transcriptional regulator [Lacticaseibacillus mingshuiensis]